MNALLRPAVALAALSAVLPLAAQTDPAPTQRQPVPEPKVQQIVIQDEGNRIEELRVRGQTQRIHVQPRNGAAYEVIPDSGATDIGSDPSSRRGAAGRRVWNVFNF
ncbi:DUF2782 domain-containing protein [Azohydromonas aeria]|uniref:DUF2782 domain-containing protein n=1 Tax=Azohydromonas aeria TaxID=2590212 RepID=UPI001E4ACBA3|nr:DUF2782 domain-containing protein [Azohydromonas aeria]